MGIKITLNIQLTIGQVANCRLTGKLKTKVQNIMIGNVWNVNLLTRLESCSKHLLNTLVACADATSMHTMDTD